jgi:glycosyltransferase involved in cell wall biosynthesis
MYKLIKNNYDQIIVHGHKLKMEMIKEFNKANNDIHVLPRGVNSIYTRYNNYNFMEEENSILFFGRIWGYKGLRYLIEAEPKITSEVPSAKIIIAGRGEDISNYQSFMKNKERFVIFNTHIPNEKVAELFQKASIVVLPYTDASQSGVVPLAYAFGKPVVVTNVGSLPEVVDDGETGYIVPPRDPDQLAKAIIDLLRNKEKRKIMGENAYKKGEEELSWGRIALRTLEIYKKAISLRDINRSQN